MIFHENEKCPVCDKIFTPEDDIVFCPVCGTPHHRECYNSLGKCVNEDKHESGFEYKFEEKKQSNATTAAQKLNPNNIYYVPKDEKEVNLMSPLVWAYVGDAVYELYVRNYLVNTTKLNPHSLHIEAIKYVKAEAQAQILEKLMNDLSEEEKEIVRRARNTKNHHLPKNSNVTQYMYSTAFEGLIGYLYLTKQEQRLNEILKKCINIRN